MKLKILSLFFCNFLLPYQEVKTDVSFDSIYKKVKYYAKNNANQQALYYSKKLLLKSFENDNLIQQAKSYYRIAEFQRKLNFKDSAFYYYNKSKKISFLKNDSIQIGRCLLNIAILESNFGDFENSDISGINALLYLKGRREKTIISIYNCLAINSKKQKLYNQAIYNYQKALTYKLTENQKNTIQNNLANIYKEQKRYTKSISILESLLKDTISNQKTRARIVDNLAYVKWLNNSDENIFNDLLLAKSIRINEKDNYGLIASYTHLSDYYKENNKKKSLFYARKAYQISRKEKNVAGKIEAIDKIVNLETPQKSIKYYKESIRLRDSLQKANTKKQYKFAKIKYNYEEEEKQKLKFKSLATENELIVEQEKNQKKNIIIIAVFLTAGLMLFIYRRKQQHNKKVLQETYNTETRIAKKLHDELGNDIYNVLTKVQNKKYETAEIVNDLDKIYLQTRTISHENDVIKTGEKFENTFKDLVATYNSDECKIILKDLNSLNLNTIAKEKQIVIYRVFSELFVNMKKHSKATLVVVSFEIKENIIEMKYADNGVGFKEKTIVFKNGLKNMENRIKTIKGTVIFENKPKKGLKVLFSFKK